VRLGHGLAFAAFACVSLGARAVLAQDPPAVPPPPPSPAPPEEIDPEAGIPRPFQPDWRTGHFLISGRFGLLAPSGNAAVVGADQEDGDEQDVQITTLASTGMVFGGTLGYGVSRHGVIEATVDYGRLGSPLGCNVCSGTQVAIAVGASYHMAQGIALDPWVSYSGGVRLSSYQVPNLVTNQVQTQKFRGIDIARLALGADFYPMPFVGLGPYLEADFGTNVKFPFNEYTGGVYAMFTLGIRVTLDPMRASVRATPPPARTGSTVLPAVSF